MGKDYYSDELKVVIQLIKLQFYISDSSLVTEDAEERHFGPKRVSFSWYSDWKHWSCGVVINSNTIGVWVLIRIIALPVLEFLVEILDQTIWIMYWTWCKVVTSILNWGKVWCYYSRSKEFFSFTLAAYSFPIKCNPVLSLNIPLNMYWIAIGVIIWW